MGFSTTSTLSLCLLALAVCGIMAKPSPNAEELISQLEQLMKEIKKRENPSPAVVNDEVLIATRLEADADRGMDLLRILLEKAAGDDNLDLLQKRGSSCTAAYSAMSASTMCDYEDASNAQPITVTSANIKTILAEHNKYRSNVSPSATDMVKMYWDPELAKVAAKWARVCQFGHDKNEQRKVPGYGISIGQNAHQGQKTWVEVIANWHSEVNTPFKYGGTNSLHDVGHYTQEVNHNAIAVGCGAAGCGGSQINICNYAFGQLTAEINRPYDKGTSCADCSGFCKNNLCDCGLKICKNGGTLNLSSCQCKCPSLYGGTQCQTLNCAPDESHCGKEQPLGYPESFCTKYSNVPQECPNMCGVC